MNYNNLPFNIHIVNILTDLNIQFNIHDYKILINKEGKIEDVFSSLTKPTSEKIISKIEKLINS